MAKKQRKKDEKLTKLKFIFAYNDLLDKQQQAEKDRFDELSKLKDINIWKYIDLCETIKAYQEFLVHLKNAFKELFDEEIPKKN